MSFRLRCSVKIEAVRGVEVIEGGVEDTVRVETEVSGDVVVAVELEARGASSLSLRTDQVGHDDGMPLTLGLPTTHRFLGVLK